MIRLNIIVEGQTEETFVNKMLRPHLAPLNIFASARCVETGRRHARIYRGGMTTYSKAKKDIALWIKQDQSAEARFTTMFDLYRLPADFPGFEEAQEKADPYDKVALLEKSFREDIDSTRFVPYIQLHEFEAILFASPDKFRHYFIEHEPAVRALIKEVAVFSNPELINDGPETAPSKRITVHLKNYLNEKPVAGPQIAGHIGLPTIRLRCPHFEAWLSQLEHLNETS